MQTHSEFITLHTNLYQYSVNKSTVRWNVLYYTDIDRNSHEISRFGGLPRVIFSQDKILSQEEISWHNRHGIFYPSRLVYVILDGQNE